MIVLSSIAFHVKMVLTDFRTIFMYHIYGTNVCEFQSCYFYFQRGKQNSDNVELSPSFKQNGCHNEGFQYELEPTDQVKHLYRPKNGFNLENPNVVRISNESKICQSDNVQHGAENSTQTGHSSGKRLSASCHDYVQTETRLGDTNQKQKKKHSCCLKVLLTVLVVAVVCSGVAVILKYIVFDAGGRFNLSHHN